MTKYRLAALDMDGTLLMDDKRLHPDTLTDLKAVRDSGVEIVYCTGRAVPEITMYREELSFIRYGSCMSGAVIYDFFLERPLFRKNIEQKYVKQIAAAVERLGGMLQFLSDTVSLARADQISRMADYCAGDLQELFELTATPVENMLAEAEKYDGFPKTNAFFPTPEGREALIDVLGAFPVSWDFLGKTAIEIKPEGISKAEGLKMLAAHLGVEMSETIAVGDGYNDGEMLEAAGFAVAMANAQPYLKEIADFITLDNNHNGAGLALREAIK